MNTELARDLQYRITKEALAVLVIHGSAAETDDYERAIILIGFSIRAVSIFKSPPFGKQATEKSKGVQNPMKCGTPLCANASTISRNWACITGSR